LLERVRRLVFGKPRDINDPGVFHHVSLIAFLAWVGLGADGLSSSSYGPDEAYRALGTHAHLSILLVLMTAVTIFVISMSYANLIEHFPSGGGGYVVATKLLGEKAGVVSGCALLVDYVLTITTSVAAGCDQLWNFLPRSVLHYKLPAEIVILAFLGILNLRGVKESVTFLAPIFLVFVVGHAMAIGWAFVSHLPLLPALFREARTDFHGSVSSVGFWPLAFILLRAYSLGGGTYTGIEAVSNGLTMLREPRVKTGKKTMALMAASLTLTAGGILFGYLLVDAHPVAGKTMNFVLFDKLFHGWGAIGAAIVALLLVSEAALLFVAAQTGFLDGPRVLGNMAVDSWVPHRFSQLSDRLVTKNGIFLMGLLAMAALLYTRGNISMLIVMYSINVFLTFSLTLLGMSKHWIAERKKEPRWGRLLLLHGSGFLLCVTILCVTLFEKFREGGWMTAVVTSVAIAICFSIRTPYKNVQEDLKRLDDVLVPIAAAESGSDSLVGLDHALPTAILTVDRFSGFGLHQLLNIHSLFPKYFKNLLFVSVAVVDSGSFKGAAEMTALENEAREHLEKYVAWSRKHGWAAGYRMAVDTEAVESVVKLCTELKQEFPRAVVFSGKLIFKSEKWFHKLLHNETAMAIQRRLQFEGVQAIVLPVRVL
jgi:amino acid transporter